MKKNIFKRINKKELGKHRASVIGLMYNEITEGDFKGAYTAVEIINKESVNMSVWTKEQSADLDKRFGGVNTRLDSLETDVKTLKTDMKEVKTRLSSLETGMKEVLRILKQK